MGASGSPRGPVGAPTGNHQKPRRLLHPERDMPLSILRLSFHVRSSLGFVTIRVFKMTRSSEPATGRTVSIYFNCPKASWTRVVASICRLNLKPICPFHLYLRAPLMVVAALELLCRESRSRLRLAAIVKRCRYGGSLYNLFQSCSWMPTTVTCAALDEDTRRCSRWRCVSGLALPGR